MLSPLAMSGAASITLSWGGMGLTLVGVARNVLTCSGTVARVVWRWDIAKKSTSILIPEASKNSLTLRYKTRVS